MADRVLDPPAPRGGIASALPELSATLVAGVAALIEAAAAEEILPRFRKLARHEIREKRAGDLVTVADEACERRLEAALTRLLPGSVVVGEEGVAADPAVQDRIDGCDPVWIVDPLDGTTNFAHGRDRFAVIVALAVNGVTLAGWIHDPMRGVMATAITGQGAWIGDRRLRIVPKGALAGLTGAFTIPRGSGWRREATQRLAKAVGTHQGIDCAGLQYLSALEGRSDVVLFKALKPWDHAAGVLMQREAGGAAALLDGKPYAPRLREGSLLLAPDPQSWREAAAVLLEQPEPATRDRTSTAAAG